MASRRPLAIRSDGYLEEIPDGDTLVGAAPPMPWERFIFFSHFTQFMTNGSEDWMGSAGNTTSPALVHVADRLGVLQITSGTAATSGLYNSIRQGVSTPQTYIGSETRVAKVCLAPATALYSSGTPGDYFFGLSTTYSSSGTDTIAVRSTNGGEWFLETKTGGVSTVSNLGVSPVLDQWVTLELRWSSTQVQALINDVAVGSPISTNIPPASTALRLVITTVKTAAVASVAQGLNVDWAAFYALSTSATGYDSDTLTSNLTVYVSTTGSDTAGNGSSGAPYATVAKAVARFSETHLNGYTFTIVVSPGTYTFASTLTVMPPKSQGPRRSGDIDRLVIRSSTGVATDVSLEISNATLFQLFFGVQLRHMTLRAIGTSYSCRILSIDSVSLPGFDYIVGCRIECFSQVILAYRSAAVSFWGNSFTLINRSPINYINAQGARVFYGGESINYNGRSFTGGLTGTGYGGTVTNSA